MVSLWRFLSGDVPGGFALFLVSGIAFLAIWIYVYRVGETLKPKNFQRWLWRVPLLLLLLYFIVWVQSPPKRTPLRLAILTDIGAVDQRWIGEGVADLTARRLRRALKDALVNPWEDAKDYPEPSPDLLAKAGYRVFRIQLEIPPGAKAWQYCISGSNGASRTFMATEHAMVDLSAQMSDWIFSQLGIKAIRIPAFYHNIPVETLEEYYRGRGAFLDGRSEAAQEVLEPVWKKDGTFWPAAIYLGRIYESKGNREMAQTAFIRAAQADTGSFEAMLTLGEYYVRTFEWEAGEAALKVVLTQDPTSARAAAGLAKIHPERLRDLRLNTPQKLLEEAIRLDPAFEKARLALIDQLANRGFAEMAKKRLLEGLALDPKSVDLRLKLGAVEIQLGHPDAARAAYEAILAEEPKNTIALFDLGVVDYRTKQYDQAAQRFETAQSLNGPIDCYYYLGLIYQEQGDTSRAAGCFQKRWDLRTSDDDTFARKARDAASRLTEHK